MRERKEITKEWLMSCGVTNVTEDGVIYRRGKVVKEILIKRPHKKSGKVKVYPGVQLYDPAKYQELKKQEGVSPLDVSHKCIRGYLVSRVVFAWFNNICPGDLDVDHIDNDPFNNSINNLQLLTRKENNNKHKARNQYNYRLTDEEIEKHAKEHKRLSEEVDKARAIYLKAKAELEDKRDLYRRALEDCKNPQNYPDCIIYKNMYRKEFKRAQRLYYKAKDRWHFWADSKHQFLKKGV